MLAPTRRQQVRAHQQAVAGVRAKIQRFADLHWQALPGYRDVDVDRLVAKVVPAVEAGQRQVATLTDTYLARLAKRSAIGTVDVSQLRGVDSAEVYRRPAVTVYTALANGATYPDAVEQGRSRLSSLIATDMAMAMREQASTSMQGQGFKTFQRALSGIENCALCEIASTQVYYTEDLLPIHPGCVPEGTPVRAESVSAVTRRYFEGELVEFVTAAGDKVRVTPNHPVLTDQGWRPADLLSEGDAVFRSGPSHRMVGSSPEVHERPTLIEDVFHAARMAFPLIRVPLAAEDFHADAANGEVDVVYTDGHLTPVGDVSFNQHPGESGLVVTHGRRLPLDGRGSLGALAPSGLAPFRGDVSGLDLGGNLVAGHLGSSELPGGTAPARFDAPAGQFTTESLPAYSERGVDLIGRLSGLVEIDRIVELRRVSWSGHVFNLQTSEGWYSSANHIVSNCDCSVEPLDDPTQLDVGSVQLEQTHSDVADFAGSADRGGRSPDYRKIMVRRHGEYGPTLSWRKDAFTGPSDL